VRKERKRDIKRLRKRNTERKREIDKENDLLRLLTVLAPIAGVTARTATRHIIGSVRGTHSAIQAGVRVARAGGRWIQQEERSVIQSLGELERERERERGRQTMRERKREN
jgi:hypothetical protein